MPLPSELPFWSFLQYSPRGKSHVSRQSSEYTRAIKNDTYFGVGPGAHAAIPYAARRIAQELPMTPTLLEVFEGDVILVPAPRSAPLVPGGLWPSRKLCQAMRVHGIGGDVLELLKRLAAVPKSATAAQGQRPGPEVHYQSLGVLENRPLLTARHHLVIVDDVVTRGATLLGCYARLQEAYPQLRVSCFALIRTMSNAEVDTILAPVAGRIAYEYGQPHRHP